MTISIEDIVQEYNGRTVIDHFSTGLENDQTLILYGPSGAGKTTLLRIILGLEKPTSGKVVLMGDYKYDRLSAGVVFQEDRLIESRSAVVNVAVAAKASQGHAREELSRLIDKDRLDIPVSELTAAERRLVAIVRAMVHTADLFLLDDPFRGLDTDARQKAISYILEAKGSNPLLITAHEEDEFDFGRKVRMQAGR
ncbi:ABC transporter ATP-binding protein [Butyrivibrio sp. MC2013]|uniref:ABC transporter ATP-binding protein n=1 Tax=Butyrivibrio sp. MC2013 TaxID=1280686 RepID=UPI000410A05B|nr:ATP-binding cassette domain-containing protein [Butyrivibrio sp. MC2013]